MAGTGGGGDDLKLLGTITSPFVLRVKLALSFKGLSYEYIDEDLLNKSSLLLSSNPVHKKVPVLIHNGNPICESQIIVQYIDEAFQGTDRLSLLPADAHERASARFWAAYVDDKLLPSWMQSMTGKTDEDKSEGKDQTLAVMDNLEAAFEECSKGKHFFGGDRVGYMDVVLGSMVSWVVYATEKLYGFRLFDTERSPRLNAWLERFVALDAAKAVLPDVDRLIDYAKTKQAEAEAAAAAAAASSNN